MILILTSYLIILIFICYKIVFNFSFFFFKLKLYILYLMSILCKMPYSDKFIILETLKLLFILLYSTIFYIFSLLIISSDGMF